MADNQATFNEVLRVDVEVGRFKEGLDRLKAEYVKWVKSLGSSSKGVLGAGAFEGLKKQVEEGQTTIHEVLQGINNLQATFAQTLEKSAAKQEALNAKRRKSAKDAAQDEIQGSQSIIRAVNRVTGAQEQAHTGEKKRLVEKIALYTRLFAQADRRDLTRTRNFQETVDKDSVKAEEERVKGLEKEAEQVARLRLMYRQMFDQSARRDDRKQKEASRELEREARQLERVTNLYRGLFDQASRRDARTAQLERRQRRVAEDIDIESEGVENKHLEDQARLREKASRELEKQDAVEARTRAQSVEQSRKELALQQRLLEVRRQLSGLEATRASITQTLRSGGELTTTQIQNLQRYTNLRREELQLTRQIHSAQTQSARTGASLFEVQGQKLRGTLAHLLRYYVLWQAIMAVQTAAGAIIEAPFLAVKEGLDYLRDFQKEANLLTGTLHSNFIFSKDMAENFRISAELAKEVENALRQRSAETGIPLDKLRDSFGVLAESGAGQSLKNIGELVTLSEQLQLILQASHQGSLAIQLSIADVAKLLNGEVTDGYNKFLSVLGKTPAEFQKILKHAKEHKDLTQQVEIAFGPYLEAVRKAQTGQQRLLDQFSELRKRIEGAGVKPLFDQLSGFLRRLNEFLHSNEKSITRWIGYFVRAIQQAIEFVQRFVDRAQSVDAIVFVFKALLLVVVVLKNQALVLADTFLLIQSALKSIIGLDFTPLKQQLSTMGVDLVRGKDEVVEAFRALSDPFPKKDRIFGPATPSHLNDPFDNRSTDPGRSQIGLIQKQFAQERAAVIREIANIEREYDRLRDSIQENVEDRVVSQQDALVQVESMNLRESQLIQSLADKFIAYSERVKTQIAANQLDTQKAEEDLTQFEGQMEEFEDRVKNRRQQVLDSEVKFRKDVNKELRDIDKDHFETSIKLRKQALDTELQLARQAAQAGFLTETELLDRQRDTLQQSFEAERELYDQRIQDAGQDLLLRTQLLNDKAVAEKQYHDTVKLLTDQRINAAEREARDQLLHEQNLRQLSIESVELVAAIFQQLTPDSNALAFTNALFETRAQELAQLQEEYKLLLDIAKAKKSESQETRQLTEQLRQLQNQRLQLVLQQAQQAQNDVDGVSVRRTVGREVVRQEVARQHQRRIELSTKVHDLNVGGLTDPATESIKNAIKDELEQVKVNLETLNGILSESGPDTKRSLRSLIDVVIGRGVVDVLKSGTAKTSEKIAAAGDGVVSALQTISSAVDVFKRGREAGGTAGGIGALLTSFGDSLSTIPVIGQFIPAIAGALTFIGGLFTNAAKKIADDVKKSFQNTLDSFQAGNTTLIETINVLEQQRAQAIIRLSGKKGGKDQLEEILPEFDNELQRLRKQQDQVLQDFDSQLSILRLHSDTLAQVEKQWVDINKQVKDYLGAGGDANKAAEFLALNLSKIQENAAQQLSDAEQEAIQNVLRLNDLLAQRGKLVEDFQRKEFDLINQGAVERRQPGSVVRGRELEDLRKQRDEQLAQLDAEITRSNQRITKEQEVFNLTSDIAALRRRDEELSLAALDAQIRKLKDLKGIADGLSIGYGPSVTNSSSVVIQNLNIEVPSGAENVGREIADSLERELSLRLRQAPA